MEEPRRPFDQLRATAWLVLVPVLALFTLPFLALEIGPSYEARFGGTPGVFTAEREDCDGAGACRWTGQFRPDGAGDRRDDVRLLGDDLERAGDTVRSVDIGR